MNRQPVSASDTFALRSTTVHFALIASLLTGMLVWAPSPAHAQPPFIAGEILVKYAPGVSKNEIAELNASHGTRILQMIPELDIYRLSIPANKTVSAMADGLMRNPRFDFAEPNYIGGGGDFFPSDTYFPDQWHLHNTGGVGATADADIDAVEGWQFTRGDGSITVAVLDSGIDFAHPEFSGRVLPGFDFVNGDNDPTFDHPHGIWVSGILAANADNAASVAGVDHFAQILPVKILGSNNLGSTADFADGLVFAANQGSDVINMSLIGYPLGGTLRNALQFARNADAILVACAGNGGIGDADVSAPGVSPLTISVGATNSHDSRASFSGTGSALDVVSPGLNIVTVDPYSYADSLDLFSGCSAATPIVSGIASLLLSIDPLLTHDQVSEILTLTADDLVGPLSEDTPGRDDFFGHGRVNMHQALLTVAPPTPTASPTATPTPTPTPEPGAVLQLVTGGVGMAFLNKRRTRKNQIPRMRANPST